MTINEKLSKIQVEFKSKKSRSNSFGKYYFRSAEDILEVSNTFLNELDVTVTVDEERISFDQRVMQVTASVSDGKSDIKSRAVVGVDLDQKGMQMPQKFGSASSYGKKYALGNLFLIDDTQDSDAANSHGKTSKAKPKLEGQALEKAKAFLKAGGSLDAIKGKYEIPAATLKTL